MLEAMETSLEAQLRAVRQLRKGGGKPPGEQKHPGMSQVDMAYDILCRARKPLHIAEILRRIEAEHGTHVDRESLVSAIAKRVARADRFVRTGPNTFSVR